MVVLRATQWTVIKVFESNSDLQARLITAQTRSAHRVHLQREAGNNRLAVDDVDIAEHLQDKEEVLAVYG